MMYNVSSWQVALISSWGQVWASFLRLLPSLLGAIVVFAVGLVLAYWVKRLVVEVLHIAQVEKLSKSTGIDGYLEKAEIKLDLINLIGTLFEWLIVLIFLLAAVDILGLSVVSSVLLRVVGYIPNVLAAALIFGLGFVVGGVVDGVVRGALTSVDRSIARPVGKIARWVVIVIAAFAAIEQLQIAQGLINTLYQGLTYTIVLAVGLSVGLGAKDVVSRILNDWYDKIRK